MSNILIPVKKEIARIRNHKRISHQKKQNLLNLVLQENLSTRQAAQQLQLKYSTAKYIVKNFKTKENNIYIGLCSQNKQKYLLQNLSIVVDISEGNIILFQNITKQSFNEIGDQQEEHTDFALNEVSRLIFQTLGISKSETQDVIYSTDSVILIQKLKEQHKLMKQK